ncbi:MAG: plastocyanin/azurin family copper-binding protein [Solirubrobacterales bacterium]
MRRGIRVRRGICAGAAAALLLALAAGCGSGGSSTAETTTVTIGGKTSTAVISSKSTTASKSSSGGLQPASTTPKYAAPPASAPVQSGVVQIEYRNIAINPDALKVKVGSTIKWTNYDPVQHNVTSKGGGGGAGSQSFASKNFGEGGTFEFKATKAGVIHYLCTNHPVSMNGTIEVVS